jgi:ParB family transcriptional regulator, chromosome partitioning protein
MSKSKAPVSVETKLSSPFLVPLSALVLEEGENVRSTSSVTKDGIKQMAAMLESTGQISPLVVSRREDGCFSVHAGGRRTRGFWHLRDQKKIAADHMVEVREIDATHGLDISLIENISQEPMHPVDEFLAYKRLEEKGYTPEGIAKAHGVKVLQVKRRMKLGEVHPDLLEQFREGKINLDQIMALASCDDQQRQLQAWTSLPTWQRNDQQIRQHLSEDEVKVDDDRVKLVGLDAYLKAGGSVRTDLFSEDGRGELLTDVGLLEMLLADKLEATAEQLRSEGWAWVEILQSFGYEERQKIRGYPTTYLPETDKQASERQALEQQISDKENAVQALWDKDEEDEGDEAAIETLQNETEALEAKVEALRESRVDLNGVDMLIAGAVVFVVGSEIVVHKPMIRIEDMRKLEKSSPSDTSGAAPTSGSRSEVEQQAEGMSDRLIANLTAHRTAAVQASLISNQSVALASLAAHMARTTLVRGYSDGCVKISLSTQMYTLRDASPTFEGSPAHKVLMAEHDALMALLPTESDDLLGFFLGQGLDVSLRVITYCSATTVNGVLGKNSTQDALAPLAAALSLDMRQWWEANQPNYLALVPKAKMIEAVVEAHGGPLAADGWDKLKKDEVLDRCTDSLKGTGWLPLILR